VWQLAKDIDLLDENTNEVDVSRIATFSARQDREDDEAGRKEVRIGLGRVVALHHRSSTLHQIH
jgi:hypothetical protein